MKINLTNLFNGSEEVIKIDYKLPLDELVYSTYNPIRKSAEVKGKIYSKADVVNLDIVVSYVFNGFCDRCAEEVTKDMQLELKKILVSKLDNNDDLDDYVVVKDAQFDLDEFISEEVLLSFPSKILCKDDCKGLCYKCGKNLNEGKCDCKKDVDPRMEALLQLLDESDEK